MDRTLIDRYEAGARALFAASDGLGDIELDATPIPGTWSIRQIIVHILESELAAVHRMRRIAAEERPLLIAYDESAMASRLSYSREDPALIAAQFELLRRWTAAWLRRTPDADFDRAGVHNQRGLVRLGEMVGMYVEHLDHHLKHLRRKREMLGKPMPA